MIAEASTTRGQPLVSVIVPTFERPEWLERALRSVLAQTHPHVEVIVVNDGGAPVEHVVRKVAAAASASAFDRDVHYVRLARNLNRSAARNAGLRLARGKYVAYLDDDDWYLPRHLELLVAALEREGAAVAYGFAQRVHEQRRGETWVQSPPEPIYCAPFRRDVLLVENFIPLPCLMHRRDCIDAVGGFDEDMFTHEDWDLLIRLAERHDFVQVQEVTCSFSWRTDGSSTSSRHRDDFVRTLALVHGRYAHLAAGAPGVVEAQRRARERHASQPTSYECSIVIPLFNRAELTRQCLMELARVTEDVHYEVVLVDNASTDGTAALLAKLGGDVQIVRNTENLGFARACNQGAQAARGKHLVFLNNDTIPLAGWLRAMIDVVERRAEVAVVGSKLLYPDGTIQHAGVVFDPDDRPYHLYARCPGDFAAANRPRDLQAVTAACMLVRREAFSAVGGFDEGFRNSFEDVDLCLRIGARGARVAYAPESVLFHLESQTAGRHDHDAQNGARLRARWSERSFTDELTQMLSDGWIVRSSELDGATRRVVAGVDRAEVDAWERVREAEARASAGFAGLEELLDDPDRWPADAGVLRFGAKLCARAGVPGRALAFWRRLLELEENAEARCALATEAVEHGDLSGAERDVDALLGHAPEHARGWLLRGVIELQLAGWDRAAEAFRTSERYGGERRKAHLGLGMALLGQGDAKSAWTVFAELAREWPDDAEVLHWLLRAGSALERWDRLRAILAAYVERNQEDASMRFALAGVYVRLSQLDGARAEYERLRSVAPTLNGLDQLAEAIGGSRAAAPAPA